MGIIKINDVEYNIVDTFDYITLADSFLKNKIGSGHGEAKLYIGNESQRISNFFGTNSINCFFCKSDFFEYLYDIKEEFFNPKQDYVKKDTMKDFYDDLNFVITNLQDETLFFEAKRANVLPPRWYLTSDSLYYELMRRLGLPNISYLSILKLIDSDGDFFYYFKLFADTSNEMITYNSDIVEKQEFQISENENFTQKYKTSLINSRTGQGDFRRKVIEEFKFCPLTLVDDERLIVATHIKPWLVCDDKEKLDYKNGLALTPLFERLFTKGFISFDNDKTLLVSPWISPMNQTRLEIYSGKLISCLPLDEKRTKYLKYHREYIFKY